MSEECPGGDLPAVKKTLLVCGQGRAGKDTALDYLAKVTGLRNAGTTSKYLCRYVAQKLGLSEEEAYRRRHESDAMRVLWFDTGNEIRRGDPTLIIREALSYGELTGGIRDIEEVLGARREKVVDLILWVENVRVKMDPTVKFGPGHCDLVVQNNGTLDEFYQRLWRFAGFAGLLKGAS